MKKLYDIFFNVVLPVAIGVLIYILPVYPFIRNHLADGLWAYALTSVILIIWNRKINIIWLSVVFVIFLGFELLQYFNLLPGTGDIIDIIFYFIFSASAIINNKFFKLKFK